MSKTIITRGSIPEFVVHCAYCDTTFKYMHFDIQKKAFSAKRLLNALCATNR